MACKFEYNGNWYSEKELEELFNNIPREEIAHPIAEKEESEVTPAQIQYQLESKEKLDPAIKQLDDFLLGFVKQFGVKSKEFEELKTRLGVDALGATDVLNKLIWYAKNRNEDTIPEEVGHMIVMLMGEEHPDIKTLLDEIEDWSEYADIKRQYDPIYKNDKQVKVEAIGKLLAKALVRNYKTSGLDQTLLQKALKSIEDFFTRLLKSIGIYDAMQYNDRVADHIAINVLMGNKKYINSIVNTHEKLDYNKAIQNNPFAKRIIDTFTSTRAKFKLTGSLAIAGQGETIYRDPASPIHDIDFVVNSTKDYENIKGVLAELNAVPYHFGWSNKQKDYTTFAYMIPQRGFTIDVVKRDAIRGNGWIEQYRIIDSNGKEVPKTPQNHVAVDFFVYKERVEKANSTIFSTFSDIYKGKLSLSPLGNNEVLFNRIKDQQDYINSTPRTVGKSSPNFIYYQLPKVENKAVNDAYNKFEEENKKLNLVGQGTDDRHYTYSGERVAQTVTGKLEKEEKHKFAERTDFQKAQDDEKKDWGSRGHEFAEAYFSNIIDENGYKRETPIDTPIDTPLSKSVQDRLKYYLLELVNSYPEGTRFAVEKKVVNTKVKGMLASTIDFLAFQPDAKVGVKVDILDWKFFNINKSKTEDIPWYKSSKWKGQMGEYITIAKQYGIKPEQIGKTRMVPFITNYKYRDKTDLKKGQYLESIEIGDINTAKETKVYLLPITASEESTGNEQVDTLVKALQAQYKKLYKTYTGEENKATKNAQLNALSSAIRRLQMQMNFAPLAKEASLFRRNAAKSLEKFKGVDFVSLTLPEINDKLKELIELDRSAGVYTDVDKVFLTAYPRETLDKDQKKVLNDLEFLAQSLGRLQDNIKSLQNRAAASIAIKESLLTTKDVKEAEEILTTPEKEIGILSKTFLEASKLPNKIIKLAANLFINRKSEQYQEEVALNNKFKELLKPFLDATKSFKEPIDAIRDKTASTLKLIRRVDKKFYEERDKAKEEGNKKFFLENANLEEYNKLAKAKIAEGEEAIRDTPWSTDAEENEKEITRKIKNLKDSLDLESDMFNGYYNSTFEYIFNRTFKSEEHLSPEYKEMAKTPAILNVWKFYTELNERGRESGFIDAQGLSFMALIQGTIIERLSRANNLGKETMQLLKDSYIVNVNEKLSHANIDEETGKAIKNVPKYFTHTDKDISELSHDLSKITAPWIHALLNYEANSELENILLTLYEVEQAKDHLQIDPATNELVFKNSNPQAFEGNEKNAALLEKIINDSIYGISEDSKTLIDIATNKVSKGTEEEKQQTKLKAKKAVGGLNRWTQMLATGGKLMVSLPNFVGGKLQGFINAGTFYRGWEFEKNTDLICATVGKYLSTIDKALIDLIHPLNEDVQLHATRALSAKQSTFKWLSTWSISDVLQSANRLGDRVLELSNAKSFNDNSMIEEGKIVNIRQYLKKQDEGKYKLSEWDRKALERTFEKRVQELKNTRSLAKVAKFNEEGLLELPGVSSREMAKYRTTVVEYARNISGLASRDNKADYTRSTIFKSFMMFKNWIPKQVAIRGMDIHKNNELGEWEYGRTRLFIKTWTHLGLKRTFEMRDIIMGNDKGLEIMREILDEKRDAYFKATGQQLDITEEEFFDMMRKELHSQSKELTLLFGMLSLVLASKVIPPKTKEDLLAQNHLKWLQKMVSKMADEVRFYYDPRSTESITRGSVMPSLSILNKIAKFMGSLEEEVRGHVISNQKVIDKNFPLKYFINLIPGPAQFQNEILPYIDPEMAKNLGIRVTNQARQGN